MKATSIDRTRPLQRAFFPWLLVCGLVCGLVAAGCSSGESAPEPAFGGERPNVLLISIDSLRADHLSCYGYERETSPNIDGLAAEGLLFETMISSTSWTLPAHAAMFTGLPDSVHGANRTARKLVEERATLAEALGEVGYETAGFWSGPYLHPHFGLDQGFEHYESCTGYAIDDAQQLMHRKDSDSHDGHVGSAHVQAHDDVTSPRIVERVSEWWRAREERGEERPFFLFVHMWDVHYDFIPPHPYDELFTDENYAGDVDGRRLNPYLSGKQRFEGEDLRQLVGLYDGEIAWTDEHVGMLLELIAKVSDSTVVILTSDHGEEFYDHGRFGHRKTLLEESVRVPLVMRYPGRLDVGRTDRIARMVDLAPTIAHLAGAYAPEPTVGRSLVDWVRREDSPSDAEQQAISELTGVGGGLFAVRTPRWKLVGLQSTEGETGGQPRIVGFYDLVQDPGEKRNLVAPGAKGRPRMLQRALEIFQERRAEVDELSSLVGLADEDVSVPEDILKDLSKFGYTGEDGEDLAPEIDR